MGEKKKVDILGREIKVGQVVAYPVRHSSSMWMSHGVVTEVGENFIKVNIDTDKWDTNADDGIGGFVPASKVVTVSSIDRVVIAKEVA